MAGVLKRQAKDHSEQSSTSRTPFANKNISVRHIAKVPAQPIPAHRRDGPRAKNKRPLQFPKPAHQNPKRVRAEQQGTYNRFGFGAPSRNHAFTTEGSLEQIACLLFRFGGFTLEEAVDLRCLSSAWRSFVDGWLLAAKMEPILSMELRPQQLQIPEERIANMALLAYRCDLVPGVLVRALGQRMHGTHRIDSFHTLDNLFRRSLTDEHYVHLERVLKVGAPNRLVETSTLQNRQAFIEAGNHSSARKRPQLLEDCANRDERSRHSIALPAWLKTFAPHLHVSPLAVLEKEHKKPRLIFDGSFRPGIDNISINDATDISEEWFISYGTAAASYLRWIWNLRISFPDKKIYQYFDDVANAFRHILLHPDVVGAHGSCTESDVLLLAVAAVFGKIDSPPEYMIAADARAAVAEFLQTKLGKFFLDKPYDFETKLPWISVDDSIPYAPAERDALNPGVFKSSSSDRLSTPHHPFVDDTCLADTRERLSTAIHAGLQALFMTLGYPGKDRTEVLSVEKFQQVACAEQQVQLGILVDTRTMTLALPTKKYERIRSLLQSRWHRHMTQFKPLEAGRLLGLLRHASLVAWWGKYTFVALQSVLNDALRRECARQHKQEKQKQGKYYGQWRAALKELQYHRNDAWLMKDAQLPVSFAVNWAKMEKAFFTTELHEELEFLRYLFDDGRCHEWSTPIAQSVPREPHFKPSSDSSLEGLGAICHELRFLMRISLPADIMQRTLRYHPATHLLITINDLELAAAVLLFAAIRLAVMQNRHQNCSTWPVVQLFLDNITAKKNINKGTARSPAARSLLRLLSYLAKGSPVSWNAEFIAGVDNIEADYLSRHSKKFDNSPSAAYTEFFRISPQSVGYEIYQPSHNLLSAVFYALRKGSLPDLLVKRIRAPMRVDESILGTFATLTL